MQRGHTPIVPYVDRRARCDQRLDDACVNTSASSDPPILIFGGPVQRSAAACASSRIDVSSRIDKQLQGVKVVVLRSQVQE